MLTTAPASGVVNGNTAQVLGWDNFCPRDGNRLRWRLLLPHVAADDHLELDRRTRRSRERRDGLVGGGVVTLGDSDPDGEISAPAAAAGSTAPRCRRPAHERPVDAARMASQPYALPLLPDRAHRPFRAQEAAHWLALQSRLGASSRRRTSLIDG